MGDQKCLTKIKTPTTVSAVGGSGSGKNIFTKRLLEKAKVEFDEEAKLGVCCSVVWQDVYTDVQHSVFSVLFYDGLQQQERNKQQQRS